MRRAEVHGGIGRPSGHVMPLAHAEGDIRPLRFAVRPLVHGEQVIAQREIIGQDN